MPKATTNEQPAIHANPLASWPGRIAGIMQMIQYPSRMIADYAVPEGTPTERLKAIHLFFTLAYYSPDDELDPAAKWAHQVGNLAKGNYDALAETLKNFIFGLERQVVECVKAGGDDPDRPIIVPELLPAGTVIELDRKWAIEIAPMLIAALYGVNINALPPKHPLRDVMPKNKLLDECILVLGHGQQINTINGIRFEPRAYYSLHEAIRRTVQCREYQLEEANKQQELERLRLRQEHNAFLATPAGQIAQLRQELEGERQKRLQLEDRLAEEKRV